MKVFLRLSSSSTGASTAPEAIDHVHHLPVKDISGMCGFEDPNYFAKVFRRGFGVSPTEFRTTGMYASAGYQQGQILDR